VRNVDAGLDCPLEEMAPHFVQQKGEDDWSWKIENQAQERKPESVLQEHEEVAAREKRLELGKPHEFTVEDAAERIVLLEGHRKAEHRNVPEDYEVQGTRNEHEVQPPVPAEINGKRFFLKFNFV
jgi:hypothetical protein